MRVWIDREFTHFLCGVGMSDAQVERETSTVSAITPWGLGKYLGGVRHGRSREWESEESSA
jgi:hypothetical protein